MVAFLKSFKRIETSKEEKIESILPEPNGRLKHSMPSSATEAANSAVPVKSLPRALSMKYLYVWYPRITESIYRICKFPVQCYSVLSSVCHKIVRHAVIIIIIIARNQLSVYSLVAIAKPQAKVIRKSCQLLGLFKMLRFEGTVIAI